jgi:hypothetical protein
MGGGTGGGMVVPVWGMGGAVAPVATCARQAGQKRASAGMAEPQLRQ